MSSTEVISTALLNAGGGVVDGYGQYGNKERLPFSPLFDEKDLRLALAGSRHSK